MQNDPETLPHLFQNLKKDPSIRIGPVNQLPLISPSRDVINRPFKLYAW